MSTVAVENIFPLSTVVVDETHIRKSISLSLLMQNYDWWSTLDEVTAKIWLNFGKK